MVNIRYVWESQGLTWYRKLHTKAHRLQKGCIAYTFLRGNKSARKLSPHVRVAVVSPCTPQWLTLCFFPLSLCKGARSSLRRLHAPARTRSETRAHRPINHDDEMVIFTFVTCNLEVGVQVRNHRQLLTFDACLGSLPFPPCDSRSSFTFKLYKTFESSILYLTFYAI